MASNSRRGLEGDGGGQDAGGGQAGRTRARQMPRSLSEWEIRNIIQSQLDDDSEGEDVAELNGNADVCVYVCCVCVCLFSCVFVCVSHFLV